MNQNKLRDLYFDWMYQLVDDDTVGKHSYRKLLKYLNEIDFRYSVPMDANRADDGESLRYRFAHEWSWDDRLIAEHLDIRPCSVLEMIVALALKCEENIMDDPDIGNRSGLWFWSMIFNLGLREMYDAAFDKDICGRIIQRFLEREYSPDGDGGLFTIKNCEYDLRRVDIWCQMCWKLDDIYKEANRE